MRPPPLLSHPCVSGPVWLGSQALEMAVAHVYSFETQAPSDAYQQQPTPSTPRFKQQAPPDWLLASQWVFWL